VKDQSGTTRLGRIEYVRFVLNPEEEPLFLRDYHRAAERLEQCDQCLAYELCRAAGPGNLLLRIEWDTSTADWPLGLQPAPLQGFLLSLKSSLKMVAEVMAYAPVNTRPSFGDAAARVA
jgi:hypothetical protein